MNRELPDVQVEFGKGEEHLLDHRKSKRIPEKTSTSASLTVLKPLTMWIITNWKILKEMEIPDHLTCLLRNLYAGQEATVSTGHGTMNWFQIEKGVHQGYTFSPSLFNLYAEYTMQNAGLDDHKLESRDCWEKYQQPQICRWYRSNGRKWRGTKEGERGEQKAGLKLNIQKITITASSPITSWHIEGEKVEAVADFIFLGSKITADGDCSQEIKRCLLLGRKPMTNYSILKSRDIALPQKVCLVKAMVFQ